MLVFGRRSREKMLSGIFSCINSNDQTQSRTMETQQEYYYTYYSYEEWGRGYIGSRGCKCLPEEDIRYFGSFTDKTFKPTQKIILKSDYTSREEAYADEIILHQYYKVAENLHFANRAYQTSTKFYVPREQAIENGKKTKEMGVGIFSMTSDELSIFGKSGSTKAKELGVGIFSMTLDDFSLAGKKAYELGLGIHARTKEQMQEHGKITGTNTYHLGIGIHALTSEQKSEMGKIGGEKVKKLGIGIHALTSEQKSEAGKKSASQKWICDETGYISNAPGLFKYQRAKGIDTTKKRRIS